MIIAITTVGVIYLVVSAIGPSEEPSSIIPTTPLRTYQAQVNDMPEKILSLDVRCDWFVLCGRYVLLKDDDYLFAGDYVDLFQGGFAVMNVTRSQPSLADHRGCFNQSGPWNAERVPFSNDEGGQYIHRVTIGTCDHSLFRLQNGLGGDGFGGLNCTVERVSGSPIGRDQLVCDDGRIWVLCNECTS